MGPLLSAMDQPNTRRFVISMSMSFPTTDIQKHSRTSLINSGSIPMSPAQEFILFSVVGYTVDKPNTDNFVTSMSLRTIVTMSFRTIVQTRTSSIHSGSKLSPTRDSDIILFWSMRSSNRPSSAIAMDEMVRLNIPYVGRYDHRHALFLFPSTRSFGSANFFECGSHSSSDVAQKISRMHVAIDFFLGRLPR